ncbi:MerR family transcriptional regulator [Streptomyces orinoci]|uniref:MerR family transcriptional regulator n=1 Tax=Streptomyces orinoci TaxID=67339 RepID=A0ABV3JSB3_STRON|nr:MerR family transcriptional regulator [Streptomyces orinoci]
MRIGETAALVGVSPRTLRYYEQEGLIQARRTPSGHRVYGPREVRRIRTVCALLATGLTIGDLRAFGDLLDRDPDCPLRNPATGAVVRRRIDDLDARIERLTELRERLARSLGEPPRVPGPVKPFALPLRERAS